MNEALRQVGKPYEWGAAGPDSFDCSGLTLWAWRAAGVTLSHYTGAQYSETTHISLADLKPGDLVYSGDMGHMAMYIGNGNIVEAPRTGLNVRGVAHAIGTHARQQAMTSGNHCVMTTGKIRHPLFARFYQRFAAAAMANGRDRYRAKLLGALWARARKP